MAIRANVQADPLVAARRAGRIESSPQAFPRRGFSDVREDLPGQKTAGFNAESEVGDLPLETCETINGAWGYNANDKRLKSTKDLIHYLVKAAGYNANFLLNVGPMPNGKSSPNSLTG